MTTRKIITVFGATGLQGGSVAWKFLQDADLRAEWAVRAVTRDVEKPAAKELAAAGAQVVAVSRTSTAQGSNNSLLTITPSW